MQDPTPSRRPLLSLSLRTKILSSFVLFFVLFLAASIYGLLAISRISLQVSVLQERYIRLTRIVSRLEYNYQSMERYDIERLLRGRDSLPSMYMSLVGSHSRSMAESLGDGAALVDAALAMREYEIEHRSLTLVRSQFTRIGEAHARYDESLRALGRAADSADVEAIKALAPSLKEQLGAVGASIRSLSDLLDVSTESAVDAARRNLERARLAGASLLVVVLVFGVITIVVTTVVLRPISRLTEGARQIGRGDYQSRVEISSEDEVGALAREFNAMARSLEERQQALERQRAELERTLTSLTLAHAELRALSLHNLGILNSISVGLLASDRAGVLTSANPRACDLLGRPADQLVGSGLATLPELPLAQLHADVLSSGEPTRREANPLSRPGGSVIVDCAAAPLRRTEGAEIEGVLLLLEDVTVATAIRQRLSQSERLAVIGKMSAQVTHEIRNPLNALGLNAELLDEELQALDPDARTEARELLASITREIGRLTDITEEYLSLARLPRPRLEPTSAGEIVTSLLRFLAEDASRRGLTLRSTIDEDLPDALVDERQLRQALLNILRNSVEASREGGGIDVTVRRVAAGVEILVRDEGEGMTSEQLARIFDPFYSTKATGTGLGLPVTQQIIEEHGGTLGCQSRPGEGTTFTITLPVVPSAGAPSPQPQGLELA